MPFPVGASTITVTGTFPSPVAGTGRSGKVVFTPSTTLVDSTQHAIYSGGGTATITNGAFSIVLLCTDDTDVQPAGWRWHVDEQPVGGQRRTYWIELPSTLGPTVDLDRIAPVSDPGGAGQSLPPTGPAGGALTGSYPNPQLSSATIASFAGLNVAGNAIVSGGDLTVSDTSKGYRFRRGGSALDLEATGADLIVSNWSGTGFNGTQRPYLRLASNAQAAQVAGKVEFVDALYGTTRHVLDGAANTLGFHGATPVARQTVIGSRADGTALTSLLSAMASLGLIVNSTTNAHYSDLPSEQGLLAWTYDPNMAGHVTAQSSGGVAGRITLVRIPIRETITWSNIWLGLAGIDAGASLSNCYLGVYDTSGTLRGVTADISSSLMTGAVAKALALTTPFTATPGFYFIAILLNGTWTTNSLTFKSSGAGISVNAGLTAPNLRYSNMLTGQTSLPSSLTLASQSTSIINTGWASQWYGVS